MIVAMAEDIRVILIKLADRLHNMRTLCYLGKQKQLQKAKETLEVYAPLAHRLGIDSFKWQLEDLAFSDAAPPQVRRDPADGVAAPRRPRGLRRGRRRLPARGAHRGRHRVRDHGPRQALLLHLREDEPPRQGVQRDLRPHGAARAGRTVKDCYGAIGVIHSVWKPIPGRFKDYVAMPKFNMYQSLHTTVIGPGGKPLEIQIRTFDMHQTAEFGIAAHWLYKEKGDKPARQARLAAADDGVAVRDRRPARVHGHAAHRPLRGRGLRVHAQGRGQEPARRRHADRLRLRRAHRRRQPLRRRQGQRPHRAAASQAALGRHRRDHHQQEQPRAVARLAGHRRHPQARQKIRQHFRREEREDSEHSGRDLLLETLRTRGPAGQKVLSSEVFGRIVKDVGFNKPDDLYAAIGSGRIAVRRWSTRLPASWAP